ncbi:hypothetical protein [Vreelandella zhuhanensis]|nr:hypothetical protein [Halomonas zhuhanensis]
MENTFRHTCVVTYSAMNTTPESAGSSPGYPILRLLTLLTCLALAVSGWYLLTHWLRDDTNVTWFPAQPGCNLHEAPCSATLGEHGRISLAIDTEGHIEALQRLPLNLHLEDIQVSSAEVDFVGRDMDMGLHRFPLENAAPNLFSGVGQVGICTQAVMPWRARVIIDTPQGKMGSWFDFDVTRS